MNGDDFDDLIDQVKCGRYDCFKGCCNLVPELVGLIRQMGEAQTNFFIKVLCKRCDTVGVNPQPPGGGTNPQAALDCIQRLHGKVCTENAQTAMGVLRTMFSAARSLVDENGDAYNVLSAYMLMIDTIKGWCADPKGGKAETFMRTICALWPLAKSLRNGIPPGLVIPVPTVPIDHALEALSSLGIPAALDECCALFSGQGATPGAPGSGPLQPFPQLPPPGGVAPPTPGGIPLPPGAVDPGKYPYPQIPPYLGNVVGPRLPRPFGESKQPSSSYANPPGEGAYYVGHDPLSGKACWIDPAQMDKGPINDNGDRCFFWT